MFIQKIIENNDVTPILYDNSESLNTANKAI